MKPRPERAAAFLCLAFWALAGSSSPEPPHPALSPRGRGKLAQGAPSTFPSPQRGEGGPKGRMRGPRVWWRARVSSAQGPGPAGFL
ncbi:hypothetical protein F2982_10670 [Rhizobium sp. BG4]|nr:hypothetical protein F2982_10670 [Rhizobium sp. BG4]